MLEEAVGEVSRLATAQTQPAGLDIEADSMEVDAVEVPGHFVAACEDGGYRSPDQDQRLRKHNIGGQKAWKWI